MKGVATTQIQSGVNSLITDLKADPKVFGECPQCGCSAQLSKWTLFYLNDIPPEAQPKIDELKLGVTGLETEYEKLVRKTTELAAKKSIEVNVGKAVEDIVPILSTFPYCAQDCRALLDPIDYVIFDGLTKEATVNQIHFVDVKTGQARLNEHQKQVKSIIEKKRLEFELY